MQREVQLSLKLGPEASWQVQAGLHLELAPAASGVQAHLQAASHSGLRSSSVQTPPQVKPDPWLGHTEKNFWMRKYDLASEGFTDFKMVLIETEAPRKRVRHTWDWVWASQRQNCDWGFFLWFCFYNSHVYQIWWLLKQSLIWLLRTWMRSWGCSHWLSRIIVNQVKH